MWTFCSSYLIVSYCNFSPEANRRMAHREAGAIHCWSAEQKLYFTVLGFSFNRGNLLRVPTPSDCRTSSSWWSMCGSTRNETNAKALARFLPTLWCRSKGYVSTELFLVSLICILLFLTSKTIHPTRMQDSKGGCPASEQHVPFEVTPYPSGDSFIPGSSLQAVLSPATTLHSACSHPKPPSPPDGKGFALSHRGNRKTKEKAEAHLELTDLSLTPAISAHANRYMKTWNYLKQLIWYFYTWRGRRARGILWKKN